MYGISFYAALSEHANMNIQSKHLLPVFGIYEVFKMGVPHISSNHRLTRTAKKLILLAAVLAIASSLLTACGDSKDPVIGTWDAVSTAGPRTDGTLFNRRSTVEFFADGTLDVEGKSANWSWSADGSLKIEFSDAAYMLETTVDGNELIMRDKGFGGDAVVTFARDLSKKRREDG